NIQTGAERMPHDLSHLGFLAGQIGRLITISTTPVIAGDSFEMDAVGALRLSPLLIIQTFFLISWFSLLLLQLLRHLFYRHLKLHRQRYILIVRRLMLVMVVFFIAFR